MEILDIVDENDNPISRDTKDNKFSKGLISRNVAIYLRDSKGNFIIVKRAPTKRSYPNRLDAAACGNVAAGESYEDAAKRELQEELGVSCDLTFLMKIFNEFEENGRKLRYFTGIFAGEWDGPVRPNEEAAACIKMSSEELRKKVHASPEMFTPGFVMDFKAVEARL